MNAPLNVSIAPPLYRLSVEQYHQMARTGILTDGAPVELIRGLLVQKMTKNPPHRVATRRTRRALDRILPPGWYTDSQEPVTLSDSEPEPDVAVAREELSNDTTRHPGPADVALVVEVADSSLAYDRSTKKEIYASSGIPVYWIVNLVDHCLEVYTGPQGDDYASRTDLAPGDSVPVVIAGQTVGQIAVSDLLP
jgi:Uma2 family endonuclease